MKYIVHKDNVSFWIDACDRGTAIWLEKLEVDIDKYDKLPDIKEYLQTVEGLDVGIELEPQTQQYILECAESFEEYVLSYDKSKDKVIP